jgi:hypothetical protein
MVPEVTPGPPLKLIVPAKLAADSMNAREAALNTFIFLRENVT